MQTIYKYPLILTGKQAITMPYEAQILDVQMQNGVLCMWAMVDTVAKMNEVTIRIYGTGRPIENPRLRYLATVQDGECVWHVFEEIPVWYR